MGIFKKKATLDPKKLRHKARMDRFKSVLKDRKLLQQDMGWSNTDRAAKVRKYNKARAKEVLGK